MSNPISNDKMKILFVVSRMPSNLNSADRVRAYNLIKGLTGKGHQIDLLAFENLNLTSPLETDIYSICHKIQLVGFTDIELANQFRSQQIKDMFIGILKGYPRRVWQFHSLEMKAAYEKIIKENSYDVIHFSELGTAELVGLPTSSSSTIKIFDLIDAVSLSVQSSLRYRIDLTWPARLIEAYTLRQFEINLLKLVNAGIVVSSRDKAHLKNRANLHVIPMGVPNSIRKEATHKDIDLVFVGNMSGRPNIDAVTWFVKEVLPLIWAHRPQTNLYIVGRSPDPIVYQLENAQIIVTGSVPDSNVYINRAKVFIAPMRIGAGQKTKLLEAFANAVPVVATYEANEGTEAQDGSAIILCRTSAELAAESIRLLNDEALRTKIGANGYKFMQENFTWTRSVEMLEKLYKQVTCR